MGSQEECHILNCYQFLLHPLVQAIYNGYEESTKFYHFLFLKIMNDTLFFFHIFISLINSGPTAEFFGRLVICGMCIFTLYIGNVPKFPRLRVWDPYKRLGISRDASEEEIWGSRNFLLQQYTGHERSEESIEAAFEKILMASFQHRKKTKINLKTRLKKQVEESPPWVKNLLSFVELPPVDITLRRLFLFAFMGGWSIINSAESGPAFQVCCNSYALF